MILLLTVFLMGGLAGAIVTGLEMLVRRSRVARQGAGITVAAAAAVVLISLGAATEGTSEALVALVCFWAGWHAGRFGVREGVRSRRGDGAPPIRASENGSQDQSAVRPN